MKTKRKPTVKSTHNFIVINGEEITDPDIKAIYLLVEAMRISTPRMRRENLKFVLDRYGIKLKPIGNT